MPALSLDHYNIFCKDLDATVRFYERYVGLTNGDRPPFPFPGAWMYAGDKATLRLEPFERLPRGARDELREEGERLVRFHEPDATAFAVR